MNARTLIVAALALVGAIVAFMLVKTFLSDAQQDALQKAQPAEPTTQVLVTARPLPSGTILLFDDMVWMEWPNKAIAENFVVEGRGKIEDQVGKVVRIAFGDKEPVSLSKIVNKGQRGFIAAMLQPNMRAVTVSVNPQSGMAGLALPGDRVDVILTHKIKDRDDRTHSVSETVFQNVRLLSVGQNSADNSAVAPAAKTITLEVTPKMAEKVSMLEKLGTLSLSLRPLPRDPKDFENDLYSMPIDNMGSLTWDNEVSQLLEPNKDKTEVTVRRGDASSIEDFEAKSKEKAQ